MFSNELNYSKVLFIVYYAIAVSFAVTAGCVIEVSETVTEEMFAGKHKTVDVTGYINMSGTYLVSFFCVIQLLNKCDKQIAMFNHFKQIDEKFKLEDLHYKELRIFYKIRFYLIVFYNLVITNWVFWYYQAQIDNSTGRIVSLLCLMQSTVLGVIGNFISTILLMIFVRFKIINNKINGLRNFQELARVFEIHENLCELIRTFNELFGSIGAAILFNCLFITSYTFFAVYLIIEILLTNRKMAMISFMVNFLWVLPYFLEIFVLGVLSHLVTSEVS